ncbi:MAG: branched-chain amino acid ABC transporter permease [Nitrososphaerota archaeon]
MSIEILINALFFGIIIGMVYALSALGLTLIYGVMRLINLSHGQMLMLSGFFSYTLLTLFNIDPIISLPLVVILFILLGLLFHNSLIKPIIKAPLIESLLITYAFGMILENLAIIVWGVDYRSIVTSYSIYSIKIGSISISLSRLLAAILALLVSILTYFLLVKTKFGKAIRACAQDPIASELMGINYHRVAMLTTVLSTSIIAIAGPLLAMIFLIYPAVGGMYTLKAYCMIVLGGVGSALGALIGGLLFGISEALAAVLLPSGFKDAVAYGLLVLLLLIKPTGLIKGYK